MNPLSRSYVGEVTETIPGERAVIARVGTGDLDRYQTVIDPAGLDLRAYRANPVVLWEHGRDPARGSMPIGRNKWIKTRRSGNGDLLARTEFANNEDGQAFYEAYRDGLLSGWSVSVLPDPDRCSPPTKAELRARPDLAKCQMMYRAGELMEYSAVAVPGNAQALTMLEARGIWIPEEARAEPDATNAADGEAKKKIGDDMRSADEDEEEEDSEEPEEAEQTERTVVAVPIDVAAIHRQYLGMIEAHYAAIRGDIRAQIDLMRGKV